MGKAGAGNFVLNWALPLAVMALLGGGVSLAMKLAPELNPFGDGAPPSVRSLPAALAPPAILPRGWSGPEAEAPLQQVTRIGTGLGAPRPVALGPLEMPAWPVHPGIDGQQRPEARWLAAYELGPCAAVQSQHLAVDRVDLLAWGQNPQPFLRLIAGYETTHGVEPDVIFMPVSAAQCAVLARINRFPSRARILLQDDTPVRGDTLVAGLDGWPRAAPPRIVIVDPTGAQHAPSREEPVSAQALRFELDTTEALTEGPYLILATGAERVETVGYFQLR